MPKKLIIFTHGGGRLANQMLNHAHLLAFQQEYKDLFDMINIAFGPYSNLFQKMSGTKIQSIPSVHGRLKMFTSMVELFVASREIEKKGMFNQILRAIHFLFSILPFSQSIKIGTVPNFLPYLPGKKVVNMDLNTPQTVALLQKRNITALAGWPIRNWSLFQKYQEDIRAAFEIRHDYQNNAKSFIAKLRLQYEVLIAVLIRQQDYRTWAGGKYFFETGQYILWMQQATGLFPNKKVAFVIASDEQWEQKKFQHLNAFLATGVGNDNFIESFAELSLCDYVMTPPSTFSLLAAFLGNLPILPLCEKEQIVSSEQILKNHLFDCMVHPHMSILIR